MMMVARFVLALLLATVAVVVDAASRNDEAAAYPTKPIRFIVGFPPGGGNDALTRLIAPKLPTNSASPWSSIIVPARAAISPPS